MFRVLKGGFVRREDHDVFVTVTFMAASRSVATCARMVAGVGVSSLQPVNDNSRAPYYCPTDSGPPDGAWFGAVMMERLIDRLTRF